MLAIDSGALKGISGESSITRYQSSDWAERGFCKQCGTSLFYYLVPAEQYHFPAGLLDQSLSDKMSMQIFVDEKPDYYDFANKTESMTGAEVFEHFGGASDS